MRSSYSTVVWVGMIASLACAARVSAEEDAPDVRSIPPFVMVIVDSSGSMEFKPGCACADLGCSNCLPDCSLTNDASGTPPADKKNSWTTLLETLTGTFNDFQCTALPRDVANGATYDFNYPLPYHQPWHCAVGSMCDYPGSWVQQENGLLDSYASRLRFGLMTFDGKPTWAGASDTQNVTAFNLNLTLSNTEPGSWSYAGPKLYHFPGCPEDYLMDEGVRGPKAPKGGLISLDGSGCTTPPCDLASTNAAIQASLLGTRTFGGTPIAAALDDFSYHMINDVTDPLSSCRRRYAVLITDGVPDGDKRAEGCACGQPGEEGCPPMTDPTTVHCPYPKAEVTAHTLTHTSGGVPAQIQQLFVVGMSIDEKSKKVLNTLASEGGSIDTDGDGNEAFFASDPAALTSTLDTLFGGLSQPISRSVPAFATGVGGAQYQISAGFQLSKERPVNGAAAPWTGILERKRFACVGDLATAQTIDASQGDKFHEVLNARTSPRILQTALPSRTGISLTGPLPRGTYQDPACGATYCDLVDLTDTRIDPPKLGLTTEAQKVELTDWMHGINGSPRVGRRLGDIYHSSPTVVGAPTDDPGDGSYSLFRDSPVVRERPLTMYVGTNDGILHAFSVEPYPGTGVTLTVNTGTRYVAGEEMWGFIPPLQLDKLHNQITSHQMSMDGTPVVKDVFFSKSGTAAATDYHSVLITGMRGGGNAYIALDVTDPVKPKFLWQFTEDDLGKTYGQAEIVQAIYAWPPGTTPTIRAMAILPGGVGKAGSGPGCSSGKTQVLSPVGGTTGDYYGTLPDRSNLAATKIAHRTEVKCWERTGRALYFVDIETGQQIKKIFDNSSKMVFAAPVVGSPVAYQDTVGSVATEGFVMDAEGLMWRIDLMDPDPHPTEALLGWTVRPFHDFFYDEPWANHDDIASTYERPILSLDDERHLVIIAGTGDQDNFDKPRARNRLVSLTEVSPAFPTRPDQYTAAFNWEQRVDPSGNIPGFVQSELVTGSMALFEGQLFAASFISVANTSSACDPGKGRLWALNYNMPDRTRPNTGAPTYAPFWLTNPTGSVTNSGDSGAGLFNVDVNRAEPDLLVQGLGATQRLSCQVSAESLSNYFASNGLTDIRQSESRPPSVWLVAQASSDTSSRNRDGSSLGSLSVQVQRPVTFSRVISWAGSID